MILLYVFIWVISLAVQYFIAKQFESVAADKGYHGSRFFHLSFWVGLPGWILVAALPDRGSNNENISQAAPAPMTVPKQEDDFVWYPVTEANAIATGETNIKCTNCQRIQFKGNTFCNKCGAKFVKIGKRE